MIEYTDEDAFAAVHLLFEYEMPPSEQRDANIRRLLTETSLARLSAVELKCILTGAVKASSELWGDSSHPHATGGLKEFIDA